MTDDLTELGFTVEAEPPDRRRPVYQRVLLALLAAVTLAIVAYLLIVAIPLAVFGIWDFFRQVASASVGL